MDKKHASKAFSEDLFWQKVDRRGPDDCWNWLRCVNRDGYGELGLRGRTSKAYRVAFELTHGPIPPGLHVLHRCDNPPCVNPAHLFLGTNKDNMADKAAKGRCAKGEKHGQSRLTSDQVREIHKSTKSGHELARDFGVCPATVNSVRNGLYWRHLLPDGHAAKVDCDKEWCPYSKIERIARATLAAHRATQPDDGPRPLAGDDDAIAIVMNMFDLEYVEADGLLAALDEHLRGTP